MSNVTNFPRQPGSPIPPGPIGRRTSPAMEAALAAIAKRAREMRPSGPFFMKKAVRAMMRRGLYHPNLWRSYQTLAERHPEFDLDHAILFVELLHRQELRRRQVAISLWGRYGGTNTRLIMLREARLALRWIRRHEAALYPTIRGAILFPELQQAAE